MNHPTLDVNDLLEIADEAIEAGDFPHAVSILRKAAEVAPLRKDVRNRLAIALEGSPVTRKTSRSLPPSIKVSDPEDFDYMEADEEYPRFATEADGGGRETISLIAKKAFDAAAGQTARAGEATRSLTNLLHQGLQTWKSSLADQVKHFDQTAASNTKASPANDPVARVSEAMHAGVFGPEKELEDYLSRADPALGQPQVNLNEQEFSEEHDPTLDSETHLAQPGSRSKKSSRASTGKKTGTRQTDVEDVLAAGIDSFIEAVGQADKKKITFGIVYFAMAALFAYACFDVSKKFPSITTIPGQHVQSASLGNLDLSDVVTNSEAISESKMLVAAGNLQQAADLLKKQLESGKLLKNRDEIRVELAAVLNTEAEKYLTNNKLSDSVATYREALKVLPDDAALQLRLANALYYLGTLSGSDASQKNSALADAENVLNLLGSKTSDNLQTHRLLALVHEARGAKSLAKASWQKVKALAPENSAESKEAASRLK